jgi:hypothetical protein
VSHKGYIFSGDTIKFYRFIFASCDIKSINADENGVNAPYLARSQKWFFYAESRFSPGTGVFPDRLFPT